MLKRKKISLILISAAVTVLLSMGFIRQNDRDFEIVKNLDIFYTMFRELNLFYVDDIDPEKIINTGITSMLNSLDPYTVFIPESEMDEFNFMTTGEYGGIGAIIRQSDDYTIIAEPYEGSPAAKAGLKAGDKLVSIDGFSTKGQLLSEVSEKLKGTPGTELKLVILSPGESKNRTVKFLREQIRINNVSWYGKLDEKTGYIRLSNFTVGAGEETKNAFIDLKNKGIERLVLDLRGNPGGLLMEAVKVSNIFIEKGQMIVSTKGKVKQLNQNYLTMETATDKEIPIVVLINRGTASAAEIVAGAIQDLDRGVLVGQRTFGKGLVQTSRKLKYNAQLKVTTAKYYIPSGRCIQALDYTHRNEDGSVGFIPDSLITEFTTKKGRKVYDGGGISPDIIDTISSYSQLALHLYAQNHIFGFATDYYVVNKAQLPDPLTFSISDEDFLNFKNMVAGKDFNYTTQSEDDFNKLVETAKRERYYDLAKEEFSALREKLAHNNENDIDLFRDEIIQLINEEIVSRYYYQSGRIMNSISSDEQIKRALTVFDEGFYEWEKGLLSGSKKTHQ
jgi:carboxyl-terminal processing protease